MYIPEVCIPEIGIEIGRAEFGIPGIGSLRSTSISDWARPATAGPASSKWASRLALWRSTSLSWWRSTSSRSAPRWAQGHRHRSLHRYILGLVEVYLFEIGIEIGPCTNVYRMQIRLVDPVVRRCGGRLARAPRI